MHRPVVTRGLGELAGAVERVDDPDPVALQPAPVVLALLAEHDVVGPHLGEQLHQQLVGGLVAGVLERPALQPLLPDLQQQVSRLGGGPGGHLVVVGIRGQRRTGGTGSVVFSHAVSLEVAQTYLRTRNGQASSRASWSKAISRPSKSKATRSASEVQERELRSTWWG